MELRKTEESIQALIRDYESLRHSSIVKLPFTNDETTDTAAMKGLPEIPQPQPKTITITTTKTVPLELPAETQQNNQERENNDVSSSAPMPNLMADDISLPTPSTSSSSSPSLSPATTTVTTTTTSVETPKIQTNLVTPSQWISIPDLSTAVNIIQRLQQQVGEIDDHNDQNHNRNHNHLSTTISKFRKRLTEIDPITSQPRYGAKTSFRVQVLVDVYDHIKNNILMCQSWIDAIQKRHVEESNIIQQVSKNAEQERLQKEEMEKQALQLQQQQEAQRLQAEEEASRQRQAAEEAELRRQAELARERRLARVREEQEWMDSIPKGIAGVKLQIETIKKATENDPHALHTAITSLHTLFQQINARPEETKFRRIRRDHEQFQQDIGRHAGGVELLIAAGFELGAIDEIPCYLSKEPNLEKDMDGWAAWFDLLKGTLEVLEEELIQLPRLK